MQFPHLSDTPFPNLNTVNVYQFQNTFDYTQWNEKTRIKLCNVIWNSDYTDVVKWDTNEDRDAWFDSLSDFWTLELQTAARIVPDSTIKLPIPYDVMARYNYLFVDVPIAANPNHQIDYENTEGIRRWYFFINDIDYLSPNATQAYLVPDVWTNFQNDIDITYMLLERGHAPVAFSDTEEFLENPIENNKYLLAPDVSFDNAGVTRGCDYVPFGNGKKYLCLASTCSAGLVPHLGSVVESDSYNPSSHITYTDTGSRYGHQLSVHGYAIGNGRDYSSARTLARPGVSDNHRIANNLTIYAIEAETAYGQDSPFYIDLMRNCPQFLNTIQACFVVDENCLAFSNETYEIAGYTFHTCVGRSNTLLEKKLEVSDFNYPEELQRFAKLYTSPYAQIEITDNDGTTYTINVEETSTLNVKSVAAIAFPYIDMRVFVEGIGGVGSRNYTWTDLRNQTVSLEMSNSDWYKYCFDWKIPTYALYMDGETAFMLNSFNRTVKQGIRQGLVNYHTTMRSANTAYENVIDQSNVANTNTKNAAAVAKANADRSADTGKINADNSADTAHTNTYNNAALAIRVNDRDCTNATNNLDIANTATADNEMLAIMAATFFDVENSAHNLATARAANAMITENEDIEVQRSTDTTVASNIGTVLGGAVAGIGSGAVISSQIGTAIGTAFFPGAGTLVGAAGGAAIGGVIGAVGGGISAGVAHVNCGTVNNTTHEAAEAQRNNNVALAGAGNNLASYITRTQNEEKSQVLQNNIESSEQQQANSNETSRTNTSDTAGVTRTNADNNRNTIKTNATNTQTTSKANALATKNVTDANADRTKNNVQDNAWYTRQASELNAKEILENGKYAGLASIYDSRNDRPVELCSYSGNPAADYMRTRGLQIKVKTQSDSAIRQAGDTFARFGYMLNQVWNVQETGLNLMKHFTYWKAAEIWVDDRESSNNAINNFIHNLFINGVTVWNDPTEIGRINVYDN